MQRRETVSGNLGRDPEEIYDRNGKIFTKFSLCVRDYEGGNVWYDILARANVAEFALRHLEKGRIAMCSGPVEERPWSGRDGQARIQRTMRADRISFGQETVQLDAEETPVEAKPEHMLALERYEHVRAYPPRWLRGLPIPDPTPDDLAVTPRDEAKRHLAGIMAMLLQGGTA